MTECKDNGWLDWRTYHFGSHVWKNAGTWPNQNQCCLALVDCEQFDNRPGCNADLQRPKVHQGLTDEWLCFKDFYGSFQVERLNVSAVIRSAWSIRNKKLLIDVCCPSVVFLWWIPFHSSARNMLFLYVLYTLFTIYSTCTLPSNACWSIFLVSCDRVNRMQTAHTLSVSLGQCLSRNHQ